MQSESTILVLSNQTDEPESIARMLADQYRVIEAEGPEDGLDRLANGIDVVVADVESAHSVGIELLRRGKERMSNTLFLAVTNDGDVGAAVEAMKLGAADCLVRPLQRERLQAVVSQLLARRATSDIPESGSPPQDPQRNHIDIPAGTSLEDLERAAVEQALAQHQGNRTHAAKTLGISVRTLQRKLKAWGIPFMPAQSASAPRGRFLSFPSHAGHGGGQSAYSSHAR